MANIIVISTGAGLSAPPPPPPPSPPPPPPPSPSCCVVDRTLILMADGSTKRADLIRVGDVLKTINGRGGVVTAIQNPRVGNDRKLIKLNEWLIITDDHDMWVKTEDSVGWGTHNLDYWYSEVEKVGFGEVGVMEIDWRDPVLYATVMGWVRPRIREYPTDPETPVWGFSLDDGAGYYAGGFAVISSNCTLDQLEGIPWT